MRILRNWALISILVTSSGLISAQTGHGTVTPPSATITSFASVGADAGLIQAGDGNFYLMNVNAEFVQIAPSGTVTNLYNASSNCSYPSGIVEGSDGNFYGTCFEGGANGAGVIFQYSLSNGYTDLYDFPTGSRPGGPPTQAGDGSYYGIVGVIPGTVPGNSGNVYHMTVSGSVATVTSVATFTTSEAELQGGSMVQANDGNFYGFSFSGGSYEGGNCCGTFYKFDPGSDTISTLFVFYTSQAGGYATAPIGNPTAAPDGVTFFDGTDGGGGDGYNSGSIVSVTTSGAENTVYNFEADAQEQPQTLFLAGDGNFYGVTSYGDIGMSGGNGTGTVFQVTPGGSFTNLADFDSTTGSNPYGGMLQAADGNFYGGTNTLIYKVAVTPAVTPPVVLTASSNVIQPGSSVQLSWQVNNASSETFSQCYAHSSDPGWTGLKATSGTAVVTPPEAGAYVYGLTCGGTESGYTTVTAGKPSSTTMLTVLLNPIQYGQYETFTATVTGTSGTPTGTVQISVNGDVIGSGSLVNGAATITYTVPNSVPTGYYSVVAKYLGDSNNAASTSSAVSVHLVRDATSIALTAMPNPVAQGNNCMLQATLSAEDSTPLSGTVTFRAGSDVLGTVNVSGGKATLSQSSTGVAQGTYGITATYSGDSVHAPSTSAVVDVTVD